MPTSFHQDAVSPGGKTHAENNKKKKSLSAALRNSRKHITFPSSSPPPGGPKSPSAGDKGKYFLREGLD